jgi:DNA/RNA-binding protein KIN17
MHTQSESHVRQMHLIGEDPKKYINDYSNQFKRDFLQLLRTSHGEKKININHFYQEYISNKEHVHMNATKWPSLTEFAKYLGREGICRVEETDKGLQVAWIDNSPEALRRQDAIKKKERQDKGDEEREQRLIQEQIDRVKADKSNSDSDNEEDEAKMLQRAEGEKIKLSFAPKQVEKKVEPAAEDNEEPKEAAKDEPPKEKISLKMGMGIGNGKPKNVFAASKKNALGGKKSGYVEPPKKPMSEAERIMKEEIERKRARAANIPAGLNGKRQKVS